MPKTIASTEGMTSVHVTSPTIPRTSDAVAMPFFGCSSLKG